MADMVPDGYLKIREAFQMFLERKYPKCKLLRPVTAKGAEYEAAMAECNQEQVAFGREFMAPIYHDQVRVMVSASGTGSLFRIPADEIAAAARKDAEFDFITDSLHSLPPSLLEKYNGRTPVISERHFTEWLQEYCLTPEQRKQREDGEAEFKRLREISEAPWSRPQTFRVADLYEAAPTGRAWLHQVVLFMTFGMADSIPPGLSRMELQVRLHPAKRLICEAAACAQIVLEGLRQGEVSGVPQRIPPQVFDRPQSLDVNDIELDAHALPIEDLAAARRAMPKAWVNVRVEMKSLAAWLVRLGAQVGPERLYHMDMDDIVGRAGARQLRLDNLRDGVISLREAQEASISEDGRGLIRAPAYQSVANPAEMDRWTLPMAVAWIAFKDMDKVTEQTDEWCGEAYFAQAANSTDLTLYGQAQIEQASNGGGFKIVRLRKSSLRRMLDGHLGDRPAYAAARGRLWSALSGGAFIATGANVATGSRGPIPDAEWQDLEAFYDLEADAEYLASTIFENPKDRYFSVTVRRDDVLEKWQKEKPPTQVLEPPIFINNVGNSTQTSSLRRLTRHERALFKVHGVSAYRKELEADPQKLRTERSDWEFFKETIDRRFPRALAVEVRKALNPKLRKTGGIPASTPVRIKPR